LHCASDSHDLPSFPPRRSSDLEKPLPLPAIQNGFARLNRRFDPGDRITLVLPMKTTLSHWPDNGVGIEHGPLVYSLPLKEEWTPDRKSTRLNSSHVSISYAVFC